MPDPERTKVLDFLDTEHSPVLRFTQEAWNYCIKLGKKHNLPPSEVANKIVLLGLEIAIIEEEAKGLLILRKADKPDVLIKVFGNHGNENTNNPST